MTAQITTQITGVKEAVKTLGRLDKDARRQLTRDYKQITKPLVDDAKNRVPRQAPLSGMARNWTSALSGVQLLPWDGTVAVRYLKPKINTRKPREYNGVVRDLAAFTVMWSGGINTLFDMAGRRQPSPFASALTSEYGPASRVMWPAATEKFPEIEDEVRKLIEDLMRRTSAEIARQA